MIIEIEHIEDGFEMRYDKEGLAKIKDAVYNGKIPFENPEDEELVKEVTDLL